MESDSESSNDKNTNYVMVTRRRDGINAPIEIRIYDDVAVENGQLDMLNEPDNQHIVEQNLNDTDYVMDDGIYDDPAEAPDEDIRANEDQYQENE